MSAVPQVPNHLGNYRFPQLANTETGITAHAGGGQTDAYQLTAQSSVVSTVASGNDSVKLPKVTPTPGQLGSVGTILALTNGAASNALKVYGSDAGGGDTINAVATGTGNAVSAGVSVLLFCTSYNPSTDVGTWRMMNSTASAVAAFTSGTIAGVTIDSSAIGGSTPAAGAFTTLSATGNTTLGNASSDTVTITGATSATYTNASGTPGTVRELYGKMITGISLTSGNLVGGRGEVTVTDATNVGSGVFLYGLQGKIIGGAGTLDTGSAHVTGVLGSLDLTGTTNTSGHINAVTATIQGVGSDGSIVNLFYGESATATVINSYFQGFAKTNYCFDLNSNIHNAAISTTGTAGSTTGKGWLRVLLNGSVVRYLPLTDTVS